MDVLERAELKRNTAHRIMADLNLPDLWKTVGDPILVGAVAYHLVVNPDIDMEIYCDEPNVESGFEVLKNLAIHPNVTKADFRTIWMGRIKVFIFRSDTKMMTGRSGRSICGFWLMTIRGRAPEI